MHVAYASSLLELLSDPGDAPPVEPPAVVEGEPFPATPGSGEFPPHAAINNPDAISAVPATRRPSRRGR
jgi:hypothetical protein